MFCFPFFRRGRAVAPDVALANVPRAVVPFNPNDIVNAVPLELTLSEINPSGESIIYELRQKNCVLQSKEILLNRTITTLKSENERLLEDLDRTKHLLRITSDNLERVKEENGHLFNSNLEKTRELQQVHMKLESLESEFQVARANRA